MYGEIFIVPILHRLRTDDVDRMPHNVPTLSHLTRPPEGENWPSVTGQRTVAQGWTVTM